MGCVVHGPLHQLTERERIVGATVLELGAGMGLCGLLAANMGAHEVIITDCSYPGLKVCVIQGMQFWFVLSNFEIDPFTLVVRKDGE